MLSLIQLVTPGPGVVYSAVSLHLFIVGTKVFCFLFLFVINCDCVINLLLRNPSWLINFSDNQPSKKCYQYNFFSYQYILLLSPNIIGCTCQALVIAVVQQPSYQIAYLVKINVEIAVPSCNGGSNIVVLVVFSSLQPYFA